MMLKSVFKVVFLSSLTIASLSAYAASPSFVFAYPKGSESTGSVKPDLTNFAKEASVLNGQDSTAVAGFVTKVYQIGNSASDPSGNGKAIVQACSKPIVSGDEFFNTCFSNPTPMDTRAKSLGVINGWANTPSSYTPQLADTIYKSLTQHDFSNYYSGLVLDMEQEDTNLTNGRSGFYQALIHKFNADNIPVGVYINPNIADFTKADAAVLNPLIQPSSKPNQYLIALYDGTTLNNINNALSLIGPGHPFKFIVEADQDANPSSKKEVNNMKAALKAHPTMLSSFQGVDFYQYTESGNGAREVQPGLSAVKYAQSAVASFEQ